ALGIADKALSQCRPLWIELGLTPSGRTKITALPEPGGPDRSKWEGLLSGVTDARHRGRGRPLMRTDVAHEPLQHGVPGDHAIGPAFWARRRRGSHGGEHTPDRE